MSIASAITAAQGRVADCYTAISAKGGTLPATQNLSNMPTAIGSIETINATTASVTPTTSAQTITPTSPYNAFDEISVSAVTSSIDNNITASNIKSGVSILGVSGSLTELKGETRSVSLTNKNGQTFTPSSGKNGITSITVTPNNQAKTITPTTSQQTISVPSGYSGFGTLTVNAVTSSIDANITAGNIKKDVQILGVTGTYTGGGGGGYSELPSYQVSSGVASRRSGALTGNTFSGITSVGSSGLQYAFYSCSGLTGTLNLSSLTSVGSSGLYMTFYGCTGLKSVNLSSLTSVDSSGMQSAFNGCSGLTSVDLSSLASVGSSGMQSTFLSCSGLTSVDLSSLASVGSSGMQAAFQYCSVLASINLSSLTSIGSSCMSSTFRNCSKLKNIYFNSLTTSSFGSNVNQFSGMFNTSTASTSGTCRVHFPSNLQSKVSSMTGYPTFGGSSSRIVIAFDLPATS